ncbi:MAG: PfkB family carbohydrate kinase, partial [[Clostridium] innocuum]|nr:PfkB family carbohydrate kinase [[Clostridium] innocuum]
MKQHIAFIGSSVADVIIRIPHLPVRQEDINIESQTLSLGGCAFNAAWMCRLLGGDPLFFSPVGTGIYGDFVRRQLQEHRIDILLESKEENGCCFCLVESDGERTFLSHHGAEYRFQKEWFSLLDSYGVDTVYVCGLELEEKTGIYILDYLQKHPQLTIYFAPGPRLSALSQGCIETLFNLHCILHLNEEEACSFTGCPTAQQAAESLYERTHN